MDDIERLTHKIENLEKEYEKEMEFFKLEVSTNSKDTNFEKNCISKLLVMNDIKQKLTLYREELQLKKFCR